MNDFDIKPRTIWEFTGDLSIRLPRFQRERTWDQKKNFRLCLSVFKRYPLGAVVVRADKTPDGRTEKFLLDGRQRRHALQEMANPEHIYDWARKTIKFKAKAPDNELERQFWAFADEYFGEPDYDDSNYNTGKDLLDSDGDEEEVHGDLDDDQSSNLDEASSHGKAHYESEGLRDLLELLKLVHFKWGASNGVTRAFDFRKHVEDLEYYSYSEAGSSQIATQDVVEWVNKKRAKIDPATGVPTKPEFRQWVQERKKLLRTEKALNEEIDRNWEDIVKTFQVLERLDARLRGTEIGYIEIKECSANDASKIFEIINVEGTPLTAEEILSAKPAWNMRVPDPSPTLIARQKELYENYGIPLEAPVRWDVGATFLDSNPLAIVIDPSELSNKVKLSLSFRLLAGYYMGGITRDDVEALGKEKVNWNSLDIAHHMESAHSRLIKAAPFAFWHDWRFTLYRITSAAVALNFAILMAKENACGGKDLGSKGLSLLDRSIFEYVKGRWRGSSDSKLEANIRDYDNGKFKFEAASAQDWSDLIEEMLSKGSVDGSSYLEKPDSRVKAILAYHYIIEEISSPHGTGITLDLDHVIPQRLFRTTPEAIKEMQHHICNLAWLPGKDNIRKSDIPLNELADGWLRAQAEKYAQVPKERFAEFSSASSIKDLIEFRGNILRVAFTTKRLSMLGKLYK